MAEPPFTRVRTLKSKVWLNAARRNIRTLVLKSPVVALCPHSGTDRPPRVEEMPTFAAQDTVQEGVNPELHVLMRWCGGVTICRGTAH